ncbi:MAG: hypothetical protein JO353_02985 [Phycisphaerae bacterium]|nr:hypothetical protein [Phycisphaerae bacterium]
MNFDDGSGEATEPRNPIAALRRFSKPRGPEERCDLCAAGIAPDHQHLLDPAKREVVCACDACAILFGASSSQRFKRVPRRIETWSDVQISDEQWQGLGVPISLAFFFFSTPAQQIVTMYPSPAGATESIVPFDAWDALIQSNPRIAGLEADVEALLVNRIGGVRHCYRAPIDECFKLVGLVRTNWRGMSGGIEMWKQIGEFFDDLARRSSEPHSDA